MEKLTPIFRIGDVIKQKKHPTFKYTILNILNDNYITNYAQIHFSQQEGYMLDTTTVPLKTQEGKKEESVTKPDEEDMVNSPKHYTWLKELCGIEVIDIIRHMDFDLGSAIKYILRHGKKSEKGMTDKEKAIQDLKKALWYVDDRIKMLEKNNN